MNVNRISDYRTIRSPALQVRTLLSPIHDPAARFLIPLQERIEKLESLYDRLVFAISNSTATSVKHFLASRSAATLVSSNGYTFGARAALLQALGSSEYYHWIDFDRLLHWIKAYPEELSSLLSTVPDRQYTILGRTERALATHPSSWTHCEAPCNRIASRRFNMEIDICVANLFLSRLAVETILQESSSEGWGMLSEWPLIVARQYGGQSIGYLAVEGNEWEDPDYFAQEIATAGGLDQWKTERYDSESEWVKRLQNSIDIIGPLLNSAAGCA